MNDYSLIRQITGLITSRINAGFIPDDDTRHYLSTACGIESDGDMLLFLKDSFINDGTIYELIVYPDDNLRIDLEKELSLTGLATSLIERICDAVISSSVQISIKTSAGNFIVDDESRVYCIKSFIRKLGLDIDLQYLGEPGSSTDMNFYYKTRAFLRKKKFIPFGDRGDFMKKLINMPDRFETGIDNKTKLIEKASTLLESREEISLDALTVKKYYYESVISENEEFQKMLKTYSMEFLMMKRIQPPSVSVDDAIETIRVINRITSIVYGIIIPSSDIAVHLSFSGDEIPPDIFIR